MLFKICKICGKKFRTFPCRKPAIYCSLKCRNKAYKGIIKKPELFKKCQICHRTFKSRGDRKNPFCSKQCFYVHYKNLKRSKSWLNNMSRGMKKAWQDPVHRKNFLSIKRSGSDGPNWKGGKTLRKLRRVKYYLIKNPSHPFANSCGYIFEHRLVMEKMIGRYLKPTEIVHHKDGNGLNNQPNNLQLCCNISEHKKIPHSTYNLEAKKVNYIRRD